MNRNPAKKILSCLLLAIFLQAAMPGAAPCQEERTGKAEIIVRFRPGATLPEPTSPETTAPERTGAALSRKKGEEERKAPSQHWTLPPTSVRRLEIRFGLRESRPLKNRRPVSPSQTRLVGRENLHEGRAPFSNTPEGGASAPPSEESSDSQSDLWLLRFDSDADPREILEAYQRDPNVLYAEPNHRGVLFTLPADPLYNQTKADFDLIGLEAAWNAQDGSDPSVVVAVVDSGVDALHPDLAPALDLARSHNFVDGDSHIFDDLGHGTRVAGIIGAAADNAEGIAGIAYGCTLLSLDVAAPDGTITVADVAAALDWAIQNGANVVNLSLGFSAHSRTLEDACQAASDAGILLVAAAGNENQGDRPVYPASFESVVGVGALGDDGAARAPWSNYNALETALVELVAPGATVFSTVPGSQYNGDYGSGSSMAAPMVSGVAALLLAQNPGQSGAALRAHLGTAAIPSPSFVPADGQGRGRLNADAALNTPMQPSLTVRKILVDDALALDPDNDADGQLDEGETVRLAIHLLNAGADVATLTGTLRTLDPEISIGTPSASWGDLPNNAFGPGTPPAPNAAVFETLAYVSASPSAKAVRFDLDLQGDDGSFGDTLTFSLDTENAFTPPTIIASDATWTSDSTYVLQAKTVVMEGSALTIEPGTTIRFAPDARLEIRGRIQARGTPDEKITFTSLDGKPYGGFDPALYINVGDTPEGVFVGDFDNDGDNDMVTTNYEDRAISLSLWNGTSHDPETNIDIDGDESYYVRFADFDDDGDIDILTFHITVIGGFAETDRVGRISLLRWNGNSYDAPLLFPVGFFVGSTAIGDVDNDGDNDIAVCDYRNDLITLLKWNGAGFDSEVTLKAGDFPWHLAIGDADNDGDNDIVTVNEKNINIFRWNGAAFDKFQQEAIYDRGPVIIEDIDGDGLNEVSTLSVNYASIHIFRWDGLNLAIQQTLETGFNPVGMAFADVDNDGNKDFITAHSPNTASGNPPITLNLGDGSSFGPKTEIMRRIGDFRNKYDYGFSQVQVADFNNDGYNEIITASGSTSTSSPPYHIIIKEYNPNAANWKAYEGIWIRSSSASADFAHCDFQFAPVLDESSVTTFADCLFDRSGEAASLVSESGSNPLLRCVVSGNNGGDGIRAVFKELIGCEARNNWNLGLAGGVLTSCTATGNGGPGMTGSSAAHCVATGNYENGITVAGNASDCLATDSGWQTIVAQSSQKIIYGTGWGISAGGDVLNSTATLCANGIKAANVAGSLARANADLGIQASGTAVDSIADKNGGAGISGASLTDCTVTHNGAGLDLTGAALRCLVAQNNGPGVSGGSVESSAILHNLGAGLLAPSILTNSWVVGNRGVGVQYPGSVKNSAIRGNVSIGVEGKPAPLYSTITGSTIVGNAGPGVKNSGAMIDCNIFSNGGAAGRDYEETRPSSELQILDLSGNYWGPVTTPIMDAHPWGEYYDIPAIHDFVDDTDLAEVKYQGHLAARNHSAFPDASPPAFLLAVQPKISEPANVGVTTFTLVFSKPMNQAITVSVTFGLSDPYTAHVVEPLGGKGWTGPATWTGTFAVQNDTGDGVNTLRLAGAVSADGFSLPDDTAHAFLVDASGGPSANNGLAIGIGTTTMNLTWSDENKPATALGYNVHRSPSGVPGTYQKVNANTLTESRYVDANLEPSTTYYYKAYLVDSAFNATQWTPPFYGATHGASAIDHWILYP